MLSSLNAFALLPSYTISVVKVAIDEEPDKVKEPNRRHRIPPSPIECVITTDGIELMSVSESVSDVLSFEIWDAESEFCVASFSTESEFISVLFSMTGEFQVRFIFADYELVGYVKL